MRFCQNYFHPIVHANKKAIDYYLLPGSLFNSNLKFADYVFSLTDIIKDKSCIKNEDKNQNNIKEFNNEIEAKIYKEIKVIGINEALQILFSTNNSISNEISIDKLKKSKKKCQDDLKLFEKNISAFLQIAPFEVDEHFEINEEIKSKEVDIINKLNEFDSSISKIIKDELPRDEAGNIIQQIKDLINFEKEAFKKLESDFGLLEIEQSKELLTSKSNRIHLILNFLKNQREKIDNARKNIYQQHEKNLDILIMEASTYNNYLRKYLSNNDNLFEEWTKKITETSKDKTKMKYDEKYMKLNVLINNFRDLLSSVQIDIDYSYDEKFVLWTIKNGFSNYFKY